MPAIDDGETGIFGVLETDAQGAVGGVQTADQTRADGDAVGLTDADQIAGGDGEARQYHSRLALIWLM